MSFVSFFFLFVIFFSSHESNQLWHMRRDIKKIFKFIWMIISMDGWTRRFYDRRKYFKEVEKRSLMTEKIFFHDKQQSWDGASRKSLESAKKLLPPGRFCLRVFLEMDWLWFLGDGENYYENKLFNELRNRMTTTTQIKKYKFQISNEVRNGKIFLFIFMISTSPLLSPNTSNFKAYFFFLLN